MESLTSWTDDIPICKQAGIGTATNEIYRKDGRRAEMHAMQDRYFHFSQEEFQLSLYGLFDGFHGSGVADFAQKRIPAELLLGQLSQNSDDETVKEALRQAFLNVDREYFESIMEAIMSRMVLKQDSHLKPDDPTLLRLEAQVAIGASAALAVILNKKLFVAGCGDTRAVLCLQLPNGELKAVKLSVDHVLGNEDEELRLRQLGLVPAEVEASLTPPGYTRCLGFHRVKGDYKEEDALKNARDEPVIADPEIHGGISLEPSFMFLLLFTSSLTDCLSQVASCEEDVTMELCRITLEQFCDNTTVTGVAQSVVDKIVRLHREQFEVAELSPAAFRSREDISLLVRKFNARLAQSRRKSKSNSGNNPPEADATVTETILAKESNSHNRQSGRKATTQSSTTTTESSDVFVKTVTELPLNDEGRIKPYVDFSHYYAEKAKREQET